MDVDSLRNQATDRFQSAARDGKSRADAIVEGVALAASEFAERFDGDSQIAKFARVSAETVSGWSEAMGSKSVDELVADSRTFVRQAPRLSIGVAVVAGFLISRFLKANERS